MSLHLQDLHLRDLNPEQLKAVRHGAGPLLIFAGAGSGKTRVLTRRIANLVIEHSVYPDSILAVTFTNKAASEMKHRVMNLGLRGSPAWVSTFHSCCCRILREHADLLNYRRNFAIYDSADSLSAIKRVFKALAVDTKQLDPRSVLSYIDKAKNDYVFPEELANKLQFTRYHDGHLIAQLYSAYQKDLLTCNAMDFGDLLCNVLTLFRLEPKIKARYQNQFQYIMIDEYQDTNRVQFLLVHELAAKHGNLCVVGDDDQSIYAFRGATIKNILEFKKSYPQALVVTLKENYRSTKTILQAANSVIKNNKERKEKEMCTSNEQGSPIHLYRGEDERDEARFVVAEILVLHEQGISLNDVAIFYRTNAQSRVIEEALCSFQIPYEIFGGVRFYERKEIKDILAYYRVLLNPQDNEALLRIINTPTRGLGAGSIAELIAYADANSVALFDAIQEGLCGGSPFIKSTTEKRYRAFFQLIKTLQLEAQTAQEILDGKHQKLNQVQRSQAIADLLKLIAEKTGYIAKLKAQETEEAQSRIENIEELFRVAVEFVHHGLESGAQLQLTDFIERASLCSDLDQENTKTAVNQTLRGTVSLMTLHLAKGLEFDTVFLLGLEEGLLPHIRSLNESAAIEEERRLFYVGMTRAKKKLYLTEAKERNTYGRNSWCYGQTSRFLWEIPEECTKHRV